MTRRQLVAGLRSLHEATEITNIRRVKRSGAIIIDYHPVGKLSGPRIPWEGQLIIADPNHQPPPNGKTEGKT